MTGSDNNGRDSCIGPVQTVTYDKDRQQRETRARETETGHRGVSLLPAADGRIDSSTRLVREGQRQGQGPGACLPPPAADAALHAARWPPAGALRPSCATFRGRPAGCGRSPSRARAPCSSDRPACCSPLTRSSRRSATISRGTTDECSPVN